MTGTEPPLLAAASDGNPLAAPGESQGYSALLRNSRFRWLFMAMIASSLGDWIGVIAILSLTEAILGTTRAAGLAVSAVMMARVVPTLLLGPVAGVFVDRWDRKRVMIVTDIGRGVVMAAMAFSVDVVHLIIGTLLIEVMSTLFGPAKDATLPNLVRPERLVQASTVSLMSTYGTLPLGGAMFALLVGAAGWFSGWDFIADRPVAIAIWFNAITFFLSAIFIALIDMPQQRRLHRPTDHGSGAVAELAEGLKFIRDHRLIRALIGGVMAAFLAAGIVIAAAPFFTPVLNAGDSGFGVLVAAVGTGLFAGLLLAGKLSTRLATERLFAPGIGIAGVSLMVVALMPRLMIALVPAAIMGLGAGIGFISGYTLLQQHSTDELRGRTFAAFNTGVRAALFAALVIGPSTIAAIGPEQVNPATGIYDYSIGGVRITLMLGGLVALIGAIWTGRSVHDVLVDLSKGVAIDGHPPRPARVGVFVAFEGGEGAGKTTQIARLQDAIKRAGFEVVVTREPGGTPLAEDLRALVLDPRREIDPRAEALIYAAARAQHVAEVIAPALDRGAIVLCDRFIDSSIAYQGVARGLGTDWIWALSSWATDGLFPDRVILMDIDATEGLRRVGEEADRLEAAGLEFHAMVNQAYRDRAIADPGRHLVIDATRPVDQIAREIAAVVLDLVEEHTSTMDIVTSTSAASATSAASSDEASA